MRALLVLSLLVAPLPALCDDVVTQAVSFRVRNPADPLFSRTVRGTLFAPAADPTCGQTVVLLLHGLSYASYAWDFPLDPDRYSVARALARAGYVAVAVDELGYGASDKPNGWLLTVESYGSLTAQLVQKLRAGKYSAASARPFQRVVLFGHSAGTEMSELAVGLHGEGDGLIASAYTHFPSTGILVSVLTEDSVAALLWPYIYFGGTAEDRAQYMYALDVADPAVVAEDTARAQLTPSGEILTIGAQPSRTALPLIDEPVLLLLAERDALFPTEALGIDYAAAELALFTGTPDRSLVRIPDAGHSFMLHPNAPVAHAAVTDWLGDRFPACR